MAQQMRKGEKAKIFCPGETGQGGNNDLGSMVGMTTQINEYTPLTYELTMEDCDLNPASFYDVPPAKDWDEGRPIRGMEYFRFVNERTTKDGTPLCLESEFEDAYAPSVTGLYNVVANPCKSNKRTGAQEWYYDPHDLTIHSVLHPNSVILEGYNKNIVVYKNLLLDSQRFHYKEKSKHWCNKHTTHCMDIKGVPEKMADNSISVVTAKEETDTGFIWKIEYSGGYFG